MTVSGTPDIEFFAHGSPSPAWESRVRRILEECYPRLGPPLPHRVELHLLETAARLEEFLAREKAALGIVTSGEESFVCTHDAWRGEPRLLVCLERLAQFTEEAAQGAIRHEAAHSVLHGHPRYYMFRIAQDCRAQANQLGMEMPLLQQLLFLVSVAVKDFEASRLLASRGYIVCQAALARWQFTVTDEDREAWAIAKHHRLARLVYFAAQLKPLLFIQPLLPYLERETQQMSEPLLSLMGEMGAGLVGLTKAICVRLADDTHRNVAVALEELLRTA